jgi:hypothetical protein
MYCGGSGNSHDKVFARSPIVPLENSYNSGFSLQTFCRIPLPLARFEMRSRAGVSAMLLAARAPSYGMGGVPLVRFEGASIAARATLRVMA